MSVVGPENIPEEDDQLDGCSDPHSEQRCNKPISNEDHTHTAHEKQINDKDKLQSPPVCSSKRRQKLNIATSATKKLSAAVKAFLASRNSQRKINSPTAKNDVLAGEPHAASSHMETRPRNPLLTSLIQSPILPVGGLVTSPPNSNANLSTLNSNSSMSTVATHIKNQLQPSSSGEQAQPKPLIHEESSALVSSSPTPTVQMSTTVMPILAPVSSSTNAVPVPQMPTISMPTLVPVSASPVEIPPTKVISVPSRTSATLMPTLVPITASPIAISSTKATTVSTVAMKQSVMPVLSKQKLSKDLVSKQSPVVSLSDIRCGNEADGKYPLMNSKDNISTKTDSGRTNMTSTLSVQSSAAQTGKNSKQPVMTLYMKKSPSGQLILTQAISHVKCSTGTDSKHSSTSTTRGPFNIGGTLGKIPTICNNKEIAASTVIPGPYIRHSGVIAQPNRQPCLAATNIAGLSPRVLQSMSAASSVQIWNQSPTYASSVRHSVSALTPSPSVQIQMPLCREANGTFKNNAVLPQNEIEACKIWARQTRRCFLKSEPNASDTHIFMQQAICWTKMTHHQKMPYIKEAQRIEEQKMARQHNVIEIPRPLHWNGPTTVNPFMAKLVSTSNTPAKTEGPIKYIKSSTSRQGNTNTVVNTSNGTFQLHNIVSSGSHPAKITLQWKPVASKGENITQASPANLISIPDCKIPQNHVKKHDKSDSPTTRTPNPTLAKMMRGANYVADHPERFISDRFLRKTTSDDAYDMDDLLEDAERGPHWRGRGPDIVPNWLVDFVAEYDSSSKLDRKSRNKTSDASSYDPNMGKSASAVIKTPLSSESTHDDKQKTKFSTGDSVRQSVTVRKNSLTAERISGTDEKATITSADKNRSSTKEKESTTNKSDTPNNESVPVSVGKSIADDSSTFQCSLERTGNIKTTDITSNDLDDLGDIDQIPDNVMWNMCIRLFPNGRRVRLWRDNTEELERFLDKISPNSGTEIKQAGLNEKETEKISVETELKIKEETGAKNKDDVTTKPNDDDTVVISGTEKPTSESSVFKELGPTADHTNVDKDCSDGHSDVVSKETVGAAQEGDANNTGMVQNSDDSHPAIIDRNNGDTKFNTTTGLNITGECVEMPKGQCDLAPERDEQDGDVTVESGTQNGKEVDRVIVNYDKDMCEKGDFEDWELIDMSMVTHSNSTETISDSSSNNDRGITNNWPTNVPNPNSNVLNVPRPSASKVELSIEHTPGLSYVDYENIPTCSNDFTFGKPISMTAYEEKCKPPRKKWQLRLAAPKKKRTKMKLKSTDPSVISLGGRDRDDARGIDDAVDLAIDRIIADEQTKLQGIDSLNSHREDETIAAADDEQSPSLKAGLCDQDVKEDSLKKCDDLLDNECFHELPCILIFREPCILEKQSGNLALIPQTVDRDEFGGDDFGPRTSSRHSIRTSSPDKRTTVENEIVQEAKDMKIPATTSSETADVGKKSSSKKIRQQPKRRRCSTGAKTNDANLRESETLSQTEKSVMVRKVSSTNSRSKKGGIGAKEIKAAIKRMTGRRNKRCVENTEKRHAKSAACEEEKTNKEYMGKVPISDDETMTKMEIQGSTRIEYSDESANNVQSTNGKQGKERPGNNETIDRENETSDAEIGSNATDVENIQSDAANDVRGEENTNSIRSEELKTRSESSIEFVGSKQTNVIRARSENNAEIRIRSDNRTGRMRTRLRCFTKRNIQDDDKKQATRANDTELAVEFNQRSPCKRNRRDLQTPENLTKPRTRSSKRDVSAVKDTDKKDQEKTTRYRSGSRGEPVAARCYSTRSASKKTRRK